MNKQFTDDRKKQMVLLLRECKLIKVSVRPSFWFVSWIGKELLLMGTSNCIPFWRISLVYTVKCVHLLPHQLYLKELCPLEMYRCTKMHAQDNVKLLELTQMSISGKQVKKIPVQPYRKPLPGYKRNEVNFCIMIQKDTQGISSKKRSRSRTFT